MATGDEAAAMAAAMMEALGSDRLFEMATFDDPRQRVSQIQQDRIRRIDQARREDFLAHANDERTQGIAAWHDTSMHENAEKGSERPEFADGQSHRQRLSEKMEHENWNRRHMGGGRGGGHFGNSHHPQQVTNFPRHPARPPHRAPSPTKAIPNYELGHNKHAGRFGSRAVPRNGPTLPSKSTRAPDPRAAGTVRFVRGQVVSGNTAPSTSREQNISTNAVSNTTRVPVAPLPTGAIAHKLSKAGLLAPQSPSGVNRMVRRPVHPTASAPRGPPQVSAETIDRLIQHWASLPRAELEPILQKQPQRADAVETARKHLFWRALAHAKDPESQAVQHHYSGLFLAHKWLLQEAMKVKKLVEEGDHRAIRQYCAVSDENADFFNLGENKYGAVEDETPKKKNTPTKPVISAQSNPTIQRQINTINEALNTIHTTNNTAMKQSTQAKTAVDESKPNPNETKSAAPTSSKVSKSEAESATPKREMDLKIRIKAALAKQKAEAGKKSPVENTTPSPINVMPGSFPLTPEDMIEEAPTATPALEKNSTFAMKFEAACRAQQMDDVKTSSAETSTEEPNANDKMKKSTFAIAFEAAVKKQQAMNTRDFINHLERFGHDLKHCGCEIMGNMRKGPGGLWEVFR